MEKIGTAGVDISKRVFQLRGSTACSESRHWGRRIIELGHGRRHVPPVRPEAARTDAAPAPGRIS